MTSTRLLFAATDIFVYANVGSNDVHVKELALANVGGWKLERNSAATHLALRLYFRLRSSETDHNDETQRIAMCR